LDNALSIAVTENIAWDTAAHISLSADDARGRVAHLLVSLASAIGEITHEGVDLKVLNEDLAEGANVTPFTVSRCLRDWEHKGVIARESDVRISEEQSIGDGDAKCRLSTLT
jgi:CRP-like cAMP-binding protein